MQKFQDLLKDSALLSARCLRQLSMVQTLCSIRTKKKRRRFARAVLSHCIKTIALHACCVRALAQTGASILKLTKNSHHRVVKVENLVKLICWIVSTLTTRCVCTVEFVLRSAHLMRCSGAPSMNTPSQISQICCTTSQN